MSLVEPSLVYHVWRPKPQSTIWSVSAERSEPINLRGLPEVALPEGWLFAALCSGWRAGAAGTGWDAALFLRLAGGLLATVPGRQHCSPYCTLLLALTFALNA